MADAKKNVIIIKKKKGGGHAGGHGGAWKVAYADFVTAMMCFFLVMWLMGSDEETRAAIAHYFNHPSTPYKVGRDPDSDTARPLGEQKGFGENVLAGANGGVPDTLVQDPLRPVSQQQVHKEIAELAQEVMEGQAYAIDLTLDYVKFSVPEDALFKVDSSELADSAGKYLQRLGQLFKGYRGYVTIEGHTDDPPRSTGHFSNAYEFSLARAVSVMQYMVDAHWIAEDHIIPLGSGGRKQISPNTSEEGRRMNRRVEFTLTYRRPK